ncbi:hypothetical protein PAXINDRAFT_15527 [Paxillus involutus ATCC 200175]|uniref:Uncharacterized protein n=1 Tax=Paxillus involutus ATCC 200175 TaxID=664439 RepID=A0A0C9TV47_PAXIN|nr:hypothetical protein PAXINDRAFT_15527 [Paxillus involutus ATCC 200175]
MFQPPFILSNASSIEPALTFILLAAEPIHPYTIPALRPCPSQHVVEEDPREPYTVDMLASIWTHLNLSSPLHTAVFACLTTAFYATARIGELTTKTLHSFNPTMHIKPSNVREEWDHQGNMVMNFHLPKLKSAPNGEDINWARQNGLSDPSAAFENHMNLNSPP